MQICICGWYYYSHFYQTLQAIASKYDIVVIGHRSGEVLGLPFVSRENTGLEWGAYAEFLQHYWDQRSKVLFMQDDTQAEPGFFDKINALTVDQAFIFRNQQEYKEYYSHGRVFVTSAQFLRILKQEGGIWYDQGNTGFIVQGASWSEQSPIGCQDHNAGIRAFTTKVKHIGHNHPELVVNQPIFSEKVYLGKRGVIKF